MQRLRYLFLACCLVYSMAAFGQKEDWLPITQHDLQIKEVPGNPGAPAIQLYYANYIDDNSQSEFIYHRIKILNESGRKYADVEIPSGGGLEMRNLKARTIHPDGSIVEFTGKPFDKTVFKGRGLKLVYKTFTMPDVTIGSIIEYRFRQSFRSSFAFSSDNWILQHDLYTVKEDFSFKPFEGGVGYYWPGAEISWVTLNLKDKEPVKKGRGVELSLENMPGFESEGLMPPEDNYKPAVRFFYSRTDLNTSDKFWREVGKQMNETIDHFIGNHKEIREAATEAIGNETDPEKKLRKLYARAQQIRNLSYERERTKQEVKKEKIKDNEGVVEVLKRGYGDKWDINRLFIALARAAGFRASVVMASNRSDLFFDKELLSLGALGTEIADVNVNGKEVFLEPGARFCPYGTLRWMHTSTAGLKLDKKGGAFITMPPAPYNESETQRIAQVAVDESGTLKGELIVRFLGQEALERRVNALDEDDAGKKKDLEDELKDWLPAGAIVKLTHVQGWEATDEPLAARFSVEIPSYATLAGKRLILPSYLFQLKQKDAFKHADRKYPIYFSYAFTERDRVTIKLPSGYLLESLPQPRDAKLGYAAYKSISQPENGSLVTQRILLFNGIYFDASKYHDLQQFFSTIEAGDEQQAVLHLAGGTSAQKVN